ncbi:MAG: hypothetical protein WAU00_15325 [Caldilinea sp.]|nr:hypothetical protein [Anaerolineales bacterium]
MKWMRRWVIRLLVLIVLASAVRQVYIAGIAASTLHTVEQMALRQSFAILTTTEIEPWQATLWQRPARQVFDWLWERSTTLDREAMQRYWRLRQLDAQASGALTSSGLESIPMIEDAPPLPALEDGDPLLLPPLGR